MKDKSTAAVLAFFFGGIGVHRFYVGHIGLGIFYLIFCWTFIPIFISIIDCIVWICTSDDDFNKQYNKAAIQQQILMNQQMEHSKKISETLSANKIDLASQIEKLHDLMKKGVITEPEFQKKKAELLLKIV